MLIKNKSKNSKYVERPVGNGLVLIHNGVINSAIKPYVVLPGTCIRGRTMNPFLEGYEKLDIPALSLQPRYRGNNLTPSELESLGSITVEKNAQGVKDVIEQEIGPCKLAGYSGGGNIAQHVTRTCKEVQNLILIASATPFWAFLGWKVIFRMRHYLKAMSDKGKPFRWREEDVRELMLPPGLSELEIAKILDEMCLDSGMSLAQVAFAPFFTRIKPWSEGCKVLVVALENDKLLGPSVQRRLQRFYNADWLQVPAASHFFLSQPRACKMISRLTVEWADKVSFQQSMLSRPLVNKPQIATAHG